MNPNMAQELYKCVRKFYEKTREAGDAEAAFAEILSSVLIPSRIVLVVFDERYLIKGYLVGLLTDAVPIGDLAAFIWQAYADPSVPRSATAQAFEQLESWAQENGATQITLSSKNLNRSYRRWAKRYGFEESEIILQKKVGGNNGRTVESERSMSDGDDGGVPANGGGALDAALSAVSAGGE